MRRGKRLGTRVGNSVRHTSPQPISSTSPTDEERTASDAVPPVVGGKTYRKGRLCDAMFETGLGYRSRFQAPTVYSKRLFFKARGGIERDLGMRRTFINVSRTVC